MRARYRLLLGIAMLLPIGMAAAAELSRFTLRGELQPSASSDDGRFRLRAEARVTPEAKSADGRFALKATNASCDPLDAGIFEDGFEGP